MAIFRKNRGETVRAYEVIRRFREAEGEAKSWWKIRRITVNVVNIVIHDTIYLYCTVG
jgi:hypothetical protein